VLKISMAYPLRNRLRTGMTLAMFTLVVFNLVVGIITPTSFLQSFSDTKKYGGGYDVQAITPASSAITDFAATLRRTPAIDASAVRTTGSVSLVPVNARQGGSAAKFVDYPVRGLDASFIAYNGYALGSRANGYTSDRAVWNAIASGKNFAVVDPWIVPHRRNWSFGAFSDMRLSGFYAEDPTFAPVPVDVRDPATGTVTHFTVIGVLRDSMPPQMAGIAIAQTQARALFGDRAALTMHFVGLAPGINADHFAKQMESAFLANGLEANSFRKLVNDATAASMVFLRLIEVFMALGLIVGVAALGVIAARSVVERRQQIGVLRAIGFQASTVRIGFLLESAFLALTSIMIGLALGLVLSYNIIDDGRHQATWPGVQMVVPWLNLIIVFVVVLGVALATTYLPARRASRVYPAQALRYE